METSRSRNPNKRRTVWRLMAVLIAFALITAACAQDNDAADEPAGGSETSVAQPAEDPAPADSAEEQDPAPDDEAEDAAVDPAADGDICDDPNVVVVDDGTRTVQGIAIPPCIGTIRDLQPMEDFCGTTPMTIAYVDSWAAVNAWRPITKAELVDEASKCDNVEEIIFTDGQGELEKTISDINGLVAQGVDLMVVMSDFGNQTIPAMRGAMDAGIPVVAINFSDPDGEAGVDFVAVVNAADEFDGQVRTQWLIDNIEGDSCKILHVGGSAGNPLSSAVYRGVQNAVAANDGCVLLNDGEPVTTNWNPADEQQAVAGALVQFDQIDGIMNECGTCAIGGWQAFVQAGRPLIPWASDDANELACTYYELAAENPGFDHLTFSARNWLSRAALHKAVAAFQGIENTEPVLLSLDAFEDSTDPSRQPTCIQEAPAGAIWSSTLTQEQVIEAVS